MRNVLIVSVLFMLVMTACAAEAAPTEEPGAEQPEPTSVPEDASTEAAPVSPAEETAVKQLADNLGLEERDIRVVSSEQTEFGDACLDVSVEGTMCAQVVTPGRIIVLEANGIQYKYHASDDGSRVQPATLALVWKREGGIAGFCDTLTVFLSGEVFTSNCKAGDGAVMSTFADLFSAGEQRQFNEWIAEFGEARLDTSDPKGVSDRMVVTLDFYGTGNEPPSQQEQQALFDFAQDLYQKVLPLK
jgi:hypothetical protein